MQCLWKMQGDMYHLLLPTHKHPKGNARESHNMGGCNVEEEDTVNITPPASCISAASA